MSDPTPELARAGPTVLVQPDHVIRTWLSGHVWALDLAQLEAYAPAALEHWAQVLEARTPEAAQVAGRLLALQPEQRFGSAEEKFAGPIAHLGCFGFLSARPSLSSLFFGGTSLQGLRAELAKAVAAPRVDAIVLEIDSPGGSVYGVHETWAAIRAADAHKPVYAVVNGLGASAGYWLASAARRITVTPSGEVGSIGVLGVHRDLSGFWQAAGVRHTIISAGTYKAEGLEEAPLDAGAVAAMQRRCDACYARFVSDIATARRTTPELVRAGYGEGRVLSSEDALAAHLVDEIGTLDEVVTTLGAVAGDRARRLALTAAAAEVTAWRGGSRG